MPRRLIFYPLALRLARVRELSPTPSGVSLRGWSCARRRSLRGYRSAGRRRHIALGLGLNPLLAGRNILLLERLLLHNLLIRPSVRLLPVDTGALDGQVKISRR